MADFSVKTEALSTASSNLQNISERIDSIASQVSTVLKNTRRTGAEAITRLAKDTIIVASIGICKDEMHSLSVLLADVAELYANGEKNISDKSFGYGTETRKKQNGDELFEEVRTATFNGLTLKAGDKIAGFEVTEITENGEIILEREKHIVIDLCDLISDHPEYNLIWGPMALWAKTTPSQYEGVSQKIIIQTNPSGKSSGYFNNLSDFDGEASGCIQKITYIEEGKNYKSEIEVIALEGEAEIGGDSTKENPNWLDPSTFMKGEAGVTAAKIKGNIRRGSEENNVNIGFELDIGDAGIGGKNGFGNIEFVDAIGESHEAIGIGQEAKASASAISGRVTAQAVVNGVENTIGVTGGVGGVGASGGWAATDKGFKAEVDAEIIAGLGFVVSSVWGD